MFSDCLFSGEWCPLFSAQEGEKFIRTTSLPFPHDIPPLCPLQAHMTRSVPEINGTPSNLELVLHAAEVFLGMMDESRKTEQNRHTHNLEVPWEEAPAHHRESKKYF